MKWRTNNWHPHHSVNTIKDSPLAKIRQFFDMTEQTGKKRL